MVAQRDPMEEAGRQVEERASVLIEEFRMHYQDYIRQHPDQHGHDNQRLVFEGWMTGSPVRLPARRVLAAGYGRLDLRRGRVSGGSCHWVEWLGGATGSVSPGGATGSALRIKNSVFTGCPAYQPAYGCRHRS